MNNQILEVVAQFAKQNKIGKAKLEAFVSEVLEMHKPAVINSAGRKATEETLRVREVVKGYSKQLQGKIFTSKELADKIKADVVTVNNTIRYLKDKENMFSVYGKKEKARGERGRQAVLWQLT
ncbi:hypothetical protein D3C86_1698450 [compost metagenome]